MRNGVAAAALVATLALATLLSGCLGDDPAPVVEVEEPEPVVPTIALLNRTVHRAECALYSQGYPAPADPLRPFVPEGFQLAEGSRVPGTTNVAVYISVCPTVDEEVQAGNVSTLGTETVEVLAAIPVIPPEDQRDDNVTRNYVALTLAVQGADLHARYLDWGFGLAEATNITHSYDHDGTIFQTSLAWTDGTGSYTIDSVGQAVSSVTPRTYYRLWAVQDGKATGSILHENAAGQYVGTGAALFTYDGPGAAPPQAAGTTSDGAGVESFTRYVPLGAKVPALVSPE